MCKDNIYRSVEQHESSFLATLPVSFKGKEYFYNRWFYNNPNRKKKNHELQPLPQTIKFNWKWITDINVRAKTVRFLEKKSQGKNPDYEADDNCLGYKNQLPLKKNSYTGLYEN